MHRFQLIDQKLNSKGFLGPLVIADVQNSISYKKVPSENVHKNAWI